MKTGVLSEPVLVGREKELETLEGFLNLALKAKGTSVFISGEAGTGKTRVANEFLKIAQEKSATVLSGWCLSNAEVPYFPFVEAFKSYFSTADGQYAQQKGAEVNAWLTGLKQAEESGTYRKLTPQAWKDLTFEVVSKTLRSISAENPVVLFIEDIHWADSASLALLHYISRVICSERILVLSTFRSEELTTDVEGYSRPLTEELRSMRRENLFEEIKLGNLNPDDVAEVAENMVGGRVDSELAHKLSEESRGNALFVVESLRMLSEHGGLYQENDQWRLTVETLGIPGKFKDVILRRLSQLKFSERRVLDAASVIGEKFDVELLSTVLNQDSLEVLEHLNTIARSTSLIRVEERFFQFDHAKSRETIYEEIASPLRRGYHKRVAEKLETAGKNGRLPLSEIAYHYAEAEIEDKAIKFSMDAGRDALARFSNAEAIKHFTYVLNTVSASPEKTDLEMTALEGLGDAYFANNMFEKAIETYEKLATSVKGSLQLRAYRKQMEAVFYKDLNPARLLELVNKVEKIAASDRLENARVCWNRGRAFLYLGDLKKALEDHEEALRVFEEEYSLFDVANLLVGTGGTRMNNQLTTGPGRLKGLNRLDVSDAELVKAWGESLLGIAMFHELGDARMEATLINLGLAEYFYVWGFSQEALNNFARALQLSERIGDFNNMALALVRTADLLGALTGNWAEVIPQFLKALEYSMKTDSELTQSQVLTRLVWGYAYLGDLKHAEEYYAELRKMPKAIVSNPVVSGWVALAEAVLLAAKRQWKEANEYFEKIESVGDFIYFAGLRIGLRRIYAWALNSQGRTEEAQAQLTKAHILAEQAKEIFAHTSIYANFMAEKEVAAGEEFEMRVAVVNVSRKPSVVVRIEGLIPPEFENTELPFFYSLENGSVDLQSKIIDPFAVEIIKLKLRTSKPGSYNFNPSVVYVDDLGETKTLNLDPVAVTVQPVQKAFEALPGRITTGYAELDKLLLGGLPEKYAVVLTSPATDEREVLVNRFLEAGATAGEITFYVTGEVGKAKQLAEKYLENFFLFVCNPQAETMVQNLPSVFKLNGVENLTDIDIALAKSFRVLDASQSGPRRCCVEVVSDVLLQHHAETTRRWLSALLPTLKSRGFTILAVIDPTIHALEETRALTGIFDGEIMVTEKEDRQVLMIRKLRNQKYLEEELSVTKEGLST